VIPADWVGLAVLLSPVACALLANYIAAAETAREIARISEAMDRERSKMRIYRKAPK
jgi:hypothetical protein